MKTIDLHVHSTASDGTVSPADLVAIAAALPLCAFALTTTILPMASTKHARLRFRFPVPLRSSPESNFQPTFSELTSILSGLIFPIKILRFNHFLPLCDKIALKKTRP